MSALVTQAKILGAVTIALGVIAAYYIDANVFRFPRF